MWWLYNMDTVNMYAFCSTFQIKPVRSHPASKYYNRKQVKKSNKKTWLLSENKNKKIAQSRKVKILKAKQY